MDFGYKCEAANLAWRRLLAAALLIAMPGSGAEESKLTRDGAFWVQTITGSEVAAPGGRLRLSTRGPATVRGGEERQIRYTVTTRVKARSEGEARRLLRQFVVKTNRQGDMTILTIAHSGEGSGSADLQVTAPRGFRDVTLEQHGGMVDVADLNGAVQVRSGGGGMKLDRISG